MQQHVAFNLQTSIINCGQLTRGSSSTDSSQRPRAVVSSLMEAPRASTNFALFIDSYSLSSDPTAQYLLCFN